MAEKSGNKTLIIIVVIVVILAILAYALDLFGLRVSGGDAPEVQVEGGELPDVDAEAADIDVGTEEVTVETPTIDVDGVEDGEADTAE